MTRAIAIGLVCGLLVGCLVGCLVLLVGEIGANRPEEKTQPEPFVLDDTLYVFGFNAVAAVDSLRHRVARLELRAELDDRTQNKGWVKHWDRPLSIDPFSIDPGGDLILEQDSTRVIFPPEEGRDRPDTLWLRTNRFQQLL